MLGINEFPKLRALRAWRAYAPYVPTCLWASNYYVSTCPKLLRAYVPSSLNTLIYVPTCPLLLGA